MLVLASQSPRRRTLLEAAGWTLEIIPPAIDESPHPGESPLGYALRVASEKALAVATGGGAEGASAVLAADTVVALGDEILGKAVSAAEAEAILARLSGRTHTVHTAVALAIPAGERGAGPRLLREVVSTTVRFRRLEAAEIRRYVATGEPMDKAGAYGIQGAGGALVAEIRGSYTNVVGLPLEETLRLIALAGLVQPRPLASSGGSRPKAADGGTARETPEHGRDDQRTKVAERLAEIRARVEAASARAGRAPGSVALIAVSKKQPAERVRAAYAAGQRDFGENYLQELERRRGELPADARLHVIGHVQTNKVKLAVRAAMVHTVDSERLARALDRARLEVRPGEALDILIEVNIGREPQKAGVAPEAVEALLDALRPLSNLRTAGLMCIPPPEDARRSFAALRALAERLRAGTGLPLPHLSMGMSDDFEVAIEEGATLVRVGTLIFGAREA